MMMPPPPPPPPAQGNKRKLDGPDAATSPTANNKCAGLHCLLVVHSVFDVGFGEWCCVACQRWHRQLANGDVVWHSLFDADDEDN